VESLLREAFTSNAKTKIAGALAKDAIKQIMKQRLDYEEVGGAPLLGVDGVVIIGHGRSKARAIRSALLRAAETVERRVVDAIEEGIAALAARGMPAASPTFR
ncbi:MAG: hypothetical protein N2545_07150, partial [Thermoflexales bacterium]|nr:hypothetical protein [Thermoflexales bacterium]